jgi:L-alanine-DL-glutamate epimerase-like enolase superfamily enzyme
MAFQNLKAAIAGISLGEVLLLPPAKPREITYTIPVMEASEIEEFMGKEDLFRFQWLKVKVNKELASEMLESILNLYPGPVAIDGNEAWTSKEEVLEFASSLPKDRILFLEQPLPARQKEDYKWLFGRSPLEIWGDESVLNLPEPEYWQQAFHGINVKLMKAGTFDAAISLLQTAKSLGLKTMVGCMVETSLGISAALALESLADYMDLDGFLVLRNEPFGLVKEEKGVVGLIA